MTGKPITVTELNRTASLILENDPLLKGVLVRGEISNFKPAPSGHWYFSLKDKESTVACTLFLGQQRKVRFRPENGMEVIVAGTVKIYPARGTYQIACDEMHVANAQGDLSAAFEQLKARLSGEGLFDNSHKKPLPVYPEKVALITSDTGAAVRDMIRILRARWPLTAVVVLPVRVQGTEAPGELAYAIRRANELNIADVLIIGRGGGSLEDLWAFNDEHVARAVYASEIPVISAVGHEPDVLISDFVADRRASTPSNAAEIVVPDQNEMRQRLDAAGERLENARKKKLRAARQQLSQLAEKRVLRDPGEMIAIRRVHLQISAGRLAASGDKICQNGRNRFTALAAALDAMSPLKVLTRGYAIATDEHDKVIYSREQLPSGKRFSLKLKDGDVSCTAD